MRSSLQVHSSSVGGRLAWDISLPCKQQLWEAAAMAQACLCRTLHV